MLEQAIKQDNKLSESLGIVWSVQWSVLVGLVGIPFSPNMPKATSFTIHHETIVAPFDYLILSEFRTELETLISFGRVPPF